MSTGGQSTGPKWKDVHIDWAEVASRWNEEISELLFAPKILKSFSDDRKDAVKKRIFERPDLWDQIRNQARQVDDKTRDGTWISFDWLMKPANLQKFLEGNYRDRGKRTGLRPAVARALQEFSERHQDDSD